MLTRSRSELGIARGGGLSTPVDMVVWHTEDGAPVDASMSVAQEVARVDAIDAWHKSIGWRGFGYNDCVFPSGRVYEGRGDSQGAHVAGHNDSSWGVLWPGDGNRHGLTSQQVAASGDLVRWRIERGHVSEGYRSRGHRDLDASKSCPGTHKYPSVSKLSGLSPGDDGDEGEEIEEARFEMLVYAEGADELSAAAVVAAKREGVFTSDAEQARAEIERGGKVFAVGGPAAETLSGLPSSRKLVGADRVSSLSKALSKL
ncbi:N-acetylmuramoyl-L-alanine amidase [Egibacter rhizosphaerae]|uniref:N-acetylmuramoyl-L-alanine amidase n=1 Tax=Egibacter rhizosphaerae TaxID=1670831 RepID=A0A411YDZ8_9ACTN|nr:peptidoglycan recognition family protein [Egibacter rhizosphaerae]QBI19357.1 N-acetylmuramoyl-L-alanine amidase [Egibacter rhizosphaerae]